ncbi:MAG: hypothetical protein QXP04_05425 [Candidatus Nanoarchaeia archaeon]|nr:hypothetical protein [Candidatus Jingweiarchaeum tengchongense]
MEITICADYAGNDGTMAYIYVDNYVGKFYIPSNSCNTTYWNISRFADNEMHDIKIASYFFRNYSYENIYVKNISFLSDSNIEPFELISQEHDLIDPLKIKNWYQKNCSTCKICHMTTDITNCETPIIASKEILIPDDAKFLIILAYVGYAGNDGAKAKVYLDDELLSEFKIESESEKMIKIDVGKYSGSYHVLYLVPEVYGQCSAEMIYWERVELTNQ